MNYKIIGQDGKEYGPATGEQLRQWILENRIESRTPVFAEDAKDWTFAGLLPEFAALFQPAGTQVPPTIAPPNQPRKVNGFATTGLVCGILSVTLCLCCGGIPFNVLGLIFSIVALFQIGENPQLHKGRGMAIAGIILSVASLVFLMVSLASGHTQFNFNNGLFE